MFKDSYFSALKSIFIEQITPILKTLETYNDDELFFRHCHERKYDNDTILVKYIKTFGIDTLNRRNLLHPQILKKNGLVRLEEDFLFECHNHPKTKNVILVKHNRYSPVFEHSHDSFETIFVFSGYCSNTIQGKRIKMSQGQLCFIPPNVSHTLEVFSDSIIINIIIRKSTFDEIFFNLLTANDILSKFFLGNLFFVKPIEYLIFDIGSDPELIEILFSLLIEQSRKERLSDRIMDNHIYLFFLLLLRKYGNRYIAYENSGAKKERYWDIISYIYKNFRIVTLSKIADHFNISLAYCSRLIESITNKNFTTLVRDIRMKHAQVILVSSSARIYDISYTLGYENQETFIRTFKKYYGLTPAQYRQKYTSETENKADVFSPDIFILKGDLDAMLNTQTSR
ncbi:MAG: AraC family transcriptional regulator [Treponema sp.]|jgi:AraC-like DNA-binding protein/mannose-6-phosphate isomerase-like protein (cupin superfamily)|nr:AraC family transcriptional regulator [Treponema sp.]